MRLGAESCRPRRPHICVVFLATSARLLVEDILLAPLADAPVSGAVRILAIRLAVAVVVLVVEALAPRLGVGVVVTAVGALLSTLCWCWCAFAPEFGFCRIDAARIAVHRLCNALVRFVVVAVHTGASKMMHATWRRHIPASSIRLEDAWVVGRLGSTHYRYCRGDVVTRTVSTARAAPIGPTYSLVRQDAGSAFLAKRDQLLNDGGCSCFAHYALAAIEVILEHLLTALATAAGHTAPSAQLLAGAAAVLCDVSHFDRVRATCLERFACRLVHLPAYRTLTLPLLEEPIDGALGLAWTANNGHLSLHGFKLFQAGS